MQFIDLGQFLSSEVEGDSFCVARVVDFNVNLVIILILPDQRSLQTGHLILLPVDQDLSMTCRQESQGGLKRFHLQLT